MLIRTRAHGLAVVLSLVLLLNLSVSLLGQTQVASLRPDQKLRWQRVSPSVDQPDGPVLYQLLLNASGTPGRVPVFDSNPRHLTNSPITVNSGNITIGGLSINSSGILSFANGQTFPASGTTLAGDVTGAATATNIAKLQGVTLLATGATSGQALVYNPGGGVWAPASVWTQTGNAGTACAGSPCANFLGTTDSDPLEIRVSNQRAFRIEPVSDGFGSTSNVIGGFSGNTITGAAGANIAGGGASGFANTVTASYSAVGGGFANTAGGFMSVVAGGQGNNAGGHWSAIAGGAANTVTGQGSFASGQHTSDGGLTGVFLFGDGSTGTGMTATVANQFVVRAAGGMWFGTTSTVSPQANSFIGTSTGAFLSASGVWTNNSDRDLKTSFERLDARTILHRLLQLPVTEWQYKVDQGGIRHIGPMAQDFYGAFKLGDDDKHIGTIDESGVALAAIQGLNQKLEDELKKRDSEIIELKAEVEQLRHISQQLMHRFAQVEQHAHEARPEAMN